MYPVGGILESIAGNRHFPTIGQTEPFTALLAFLEYNRHGILSVPSMLCEVINVEIAWTLPSGEGEDVRGSTYNKSREERRN